MKIVEVENLAKYFEVPLGSLFSKRKKIIKAVDGVSFSIGKGEIFGLLGPNGAGKTTTIKMLVTLLVPDRGDAYINGFSVVKEPEKVRENIGVTLSVERGFYWKLTGRENLLYFAGLYHIPKDYAEKRINYLLDLVDLRDAADRLVETYSLGMKARLAFARALLNDAPVIFLDEPTLGLDPKSARSIRAVILELKKEGKAVMLTTHYMHEAEMLCDNIALISRGKIVAIGSPNDLKNMLGEERVIEVEVSKFAHELVRELESYDFVDKVFVSGEETIKLKFRITIRKGSSEAVREILEAFYDFGVGVDYVRIVEPSLEDVFIKLTGRAFEDEMDRA